MSAAKDELRRAMRERCRAEPAAAREAASAAVCRRLEAREEVQQAIAAKRPIAVYLSVRSEISVDGFARAACRLGASLAAPRWNGSSYGLASFAGMDGPLDVGPLGIREPPASAQAVDPASVAVWIVPGVAFTADGRRLGQGGGWYDRLLAAADPAAAKLGVAYDFQVVPEVPVEPHDMRLSAVVTPSAGGAETCPDGRGVEGASAAC